jgi:hypothetical protein
MRGIKTEEGELPDNDSREIEFKKNQHWHLGGDHRRAFPQRMFLPVPGAQMEQV